MWLHPIVVGYQDRNLKAGTKAEIMDKYSLPSLGLLSTYFFVQAILYQLTIKKYPTDMATDQFDGGNYSTASIFVYMPRFLPNW